MNSFSFFFSLFYRQFSRYIAAGIKADGLEALYKKVHANIRANPEHVSKRKPKPAQIGKPKYVRRQRMSLSQRKDRIRQKTVSYKKKKLQELQAQDQ